MQTDLWHQRIWRSLCEVIKGILHYGTGKEKQGYITEKEKNSEGKVNNLLCWFAFLSCPLFEFKMYVQRQKDIQPSYWKYLQIMHTQKVKNSESLNQDVLGRKRRWPYYQERYKIPLPPCDLFPPRVWLFGVHTRQWLEPRGLVRAHSVWMWGDACEILSTTIQRFREIHGNIQVITFQS